MNVPSPINGCFARRRVLASFVFIRGAVAAAPSLLLLARTAAADADIEMATAQLADGGTQNGPLRSIAAGEVVIGGEPSERISAADLIRVDFRNRQRLEPAHASLIQLANGDRVVAGLSSMSGEAVVALWKSFPDWPPVRIPAESIAGILMAVPDGAVQRSRAFARSSGGARKPTSCCSSTAIGWRAISRRSIRQTSK